MKRNFIFILMVLLLAAATSFVMASGQGEKEGDEAVTISLWSGYPEMEPYYKRVTDEYTKQHPNVSFEIVTHPLREFEQKRTAETVVRRLGMSRVRNGIIVSG